MQFQAECISMFGSRTKKLKIDTTARMIQDSTDATKEHIQQKASCQTVKENEKDKSKSGIYKTAAK